MHRSILKIASIVIIVFTLAACGNATPTENYQYTAVIQTAAAATLTAQFHPTDTSSPIPTETETPTQTVVPTQTLIPGWERYDNAQYGFSFMHPPMIVIEGGISLPMSGEKYEKVVTFAVESTLQYNDHPFDGFEFFVIKNIHNLRFTDLIQNEINGESNILGHYETGSDPKTTWMTIAGQPAVLLQDYCWDGIPRYIIPYPDGSAYLVITTLEENEGQFIDSINQMLASVQFTKK